MDIIFGAYRIQFRCFKKLQDRNGFRNHARRTYWKALKPPNPSGNLEDQKSIFDKMNRTNKKRKQSCFATNRIVFFAQNKKNVSNQAIVRWKVDLTSVCRKYNGEISTLVLKHDQCKSSYRPNRFAKISSFSKHPVKSLKLSNEAKQKIKEKR